MGHLPECDWSRPARAGMRGACICQALRACEVRVMSQFIDGVDQVSEERGYARGLDAARVLIEPLFDEAWTKRADSPTPEEVIAAIDALKGASGG